MRAWRSRTGIAWAALRILGVAPARWTVIARSASLALLLATGASLTSVSAQSTDGAASGWKQHDLTRPQPPHVEPAAQALPVAAPSDAVVLIGPDGAGLDAWESPGGGPAPWTVTEGALVVAPGTGAIRTKEAFGDVQLHLEWMPADEPAKSGQNRSNSGVFFADGRYEVQILDSWDNETYADGRAAALYGQFPPLADASRPPDAWQTYDIYVRMPRFTDGGVLRDPARLTVVQNGVLVQNNEALAGGTMWLETLPYEAHGAGRIQLQDHGSPVRFRNLWVRRIAERPGPPPGYGDVAAVTLTEAQLDRLVGTYERENDSPFVIERHAGGLGMSMPWRPGVLRLIPTSPTTFELANTAGTLAFDLGADPAVLSFSLGGATYRAVRADG